MPPKYMTDHQIANYATMVGSEGIIRRSRIPKLHLAKTHGPHEKFDKAYAMAKDILDRGCLMILAGSRGTGKTQLAADYAMELAKELEGMRCDDTPIVYTTAMDMFASMRGDQFGVDPGAKFAAAHFLIVDEVQVRNETEWERDVLTHLIDKRYGSMRATLLIGNIRENELVAALGPSIIDRSRDGGGILFCDWPSLRTG